MSEQDTASVPWEESRDPFSFLLDLATRDKYGDALFGHVSSDAADLFLWSVFSRVALREPDFNTAYRDSLDLVAVAGVEVDTFVDVADLARYIFFHRQVWWVPRAPQRQASRLSPYATLLRDPRWQQRRLRIFERDGWTCLHCGAKDKPLHVHHTRYSGKPWEAPDEWLRTLCEDCHAVAEASKRGNL